VEAELLKDVPVAPPTSEGTGVGGSADVPEVVKESQEAAGVDPEASAVPVEVEEKSQVEAELLHDVPAVPSTSEGIGGVGTTKSEDADPADVATVTTNATQQPPAVVQESIAESGQSPEAAAYKEPVLEKKAVEKELLSEVKQENSAGEPAPVITAETSATAPAPTTTEPATQPAAESTHTDTPASSGKVSESGAAPSTTEKKKKRLSIFGKLKAKLADKHKVF